jgi:hypothetical protein
MAEVDRRGFFRILRRNDATADDKTEQAGEAAPVDPQVKELADLTLRLLADVDAENEERLAEGTLMTTPYDLAYLRVTASYIVFAVITGVSAIVRTADVTSLDTEAPVESLGYGPLVYAVLRAHHPADPPHVTRSYGFRFRADSPLLIAIREACDLPEPEPEPESTGAGEPEPTGEPRP